MKFLIDECLSPELAILAVDRGHAESTHVVWRGWGGKTDWDLMTIVLAGDWTFVTRNAFDFRGPANAPGSRGQYQRADIHAGLVCLHGPPEGTDLDLQLELFDAALTELEASQDLTNAVLEVSLVNDAIALVRYALPSPP